MPLPIPGLVERDCPSGAAALSGMEWRRPLDPFFSLSFSPNATRTAEIESEDGVELNESMSLLATTLPGLPYDWEFLMRLSNEKEK